VDGVDGVLILDLVDGSTEHQTKFGANQYVFMQEPFSIGICKRTVWCVIIIFNYLTSPDARVLELSWVYVCQ
jgi:hypothetical protein